MLWLLITTIEQAVLMMGHKICFYGYMWIIILKLSQLPFLLWSTDKRNVHILRVQVNGTLLVNATLSLSFLPNSMGINYERKGFSPFEENSLLSE